MNYVPNMIILVEQNIGLEVEILVKFICVQLNLIDSHFFDLLPMKDGEVFYKAFIQVVPLSFVKHDFSGRKNLEI